MDSESGWPCGADWENLWRADAGIQRQTGDLTMPSIPCACGCGLRGHVSTMIAYHVRGGEVVNVKRNHLDAFHRAQMNPGMLTGRQIVSKAGLKLVIGARNTYFWRSKTVMLTERTAHGSDPISVVTALHECVHARQPVWLLWLASWLTPVEWLIELRAWRTVAASKWP